MKPKCASCNSALFVKAFTWPFGAFVFSASLSASLTDHTMGAGRKSQTFNVNGTVPFFPTTYFSVCGRNLQKNQLGGVIFGCKTNSLKECLSKQLFGLPAQHFSYVKNIDPGLPLFLFNYSDRKLHGTFEAVSKGQINIDPYGWAADGDRTQYPAQVQIRVRLKCHPLSEDKFKPVIADNYYSYNHFWFELDHGQASKLISLLESSSIAPGTSATQTTTRWRTVYRPLQSQESPGEGEVFRMLDSEMENSTHSSRKSDSTEILSSFDGDIQQWDSQIDVKEVEQEEKDLLFMKLKKLIHNQSQDLSLSGNVKDNNDIKNMHSEDKGCLEASSGLEEKKEESPVPSIECQFIITQLMQDVEELKAFKTAQTQKIAYLEQKLELAEMEIQHLKNRCTILESACNHSVMHNEKRVIQLSDDLHLDSKESLFLIGGFDGESPLASMDLYCPSQNVIKPLKPMSTVRSYASVAQLNGDIYIFGGGDGTLWYDTVESYSPLCNQWTLCPSLAQKKGSLAGAALNSKIFAIGGGNGIDCFSDVEMLDLDIGRWISTRSMLQKRFSLAAVELNGVLYATGGFDGTDYLKSAERFDPREHSWTKIASMNEKRSCHSLVVLNEKLYALGGFDGGEMVPSIEVFDPRLGAWMMGEPMNQPRGYSAAAVVKDSIYIIGGIKVDDQIVDSVENYKEGQGWQETFTTVVGRRCYLSAIAI
ncbi:hypothetical protein L6164_002413 [Bauhinia variegata]|uniref:Uncharacterized protein n=1 Tax=Bauhinia variegata TaxID=167791 RepID=A0ACB9Q3L2_BAUVA|nr:hypothetical protein L6164_002413 [Bauhinia variegata]